MMTKDFEKYFPLPWHIEEDETGQLRTLCPASGTAFMDFGIVEGPLDFDGYDVQEYLVKCANLMPEIAHDLKLFFDRRAYIRSPVSEVDLKRLYNRIAELVGTAQIEETELPD